MKNVYRWHLSVFLLLAAVFARPSAYAQPITTTPDAGGGASSATGDAGVSVLSSGASDGDASVAPRTTAPSSNVSAFITEDAGQSVPARPNPTTAQLDALRQLEAEVNGFLERGQGFRASVNGLLARHHERQLQRLRQGFDRQISAERAAEAQARRHAIEVFERFLEIYPEDPDRTPDVMFRLAELYFDESAYAKLDADERMDQLINERRNQGLPADDLQPAPVDYRCSILLYRHIMTRFQSFRLNDATHYLMGWVLKEMGHEDEAISSYKGLVCPSRFRYERERAFDLMAPLQPTDQPVACGHLFEVLRPRGPELITPLASMADAGADASADAGELDQNAVAALAQINEGSPLPIPRDYADCDPMRGANGQPSRYAGETWYYIGDYHFDNARADEGNALAIAAYQAAMRASERRRVAATTQTQNAGIQGAGVNLTGEQQSAAARAQFDAQTEYGQFWPKALYKIGWAYFRMQHGYPQALRNFSYLLDYYDYVGAEAAAGGNRTDTIKWIGVIFSESDWQLAANDDAIRCQQVVETAAHPPTDATRPFDCAGVMRIVSPSDPERVLATQNAANQRPASVPGRTAYIPQDRPWTPEAYLELANDYFQQTKYYEAITLYRLFLALYPLHFQAPRVAEGIALAYERQRQFDQAISARGRLAGYTEGSEWWAVNANHPDAQRYAEQIARNSLHDTAIQHHQSAGRLRQQALDQLGRARSLQGQAQAEAQARAVELFRQADTEYAAAVQAYTQFIRNYPNDEAAYEFRYNRGDALFWAKRYQESAAAYAEVRESNENDQYLAPSAYMVVKSQEMYIRTLAQSRQMDPCLAIRAGIRREELLDESGNPMLNEDQATACSSPPTNGTGPNAAPIELNIPEPVQTLMQARVAYSTNRALASQDNAAALRDVVQIDSAHPENNPPYRPKFAYLNARTFMRYGHLREAEELYRRILDLYCDDAAVAGAAYGDLRNMLIIQGNQEAVETLASAQQQRTCQGVQSDTVVGDITNGVFRRAMETYRSAERAPADQSGPLYERAAAQMQDAVNRNRNHPQAALAMFYTALAYERTGRFDTATQTYIRITENYNSTRNAAGTELSGDDLAQRVNILEQSNFRAGVNLERIFDYDNAIRYYNTVATDARFNSATDHAAHVRDALASIALITSNLGRWQQARQAWQNFLPHTQPGRERAEAEFRIAEIPYKANDWSNAVRSLQDYLRQATPTADNAQFRVQAQYDIALAWRNQQNETNYRRALREVATVFRSSGQQPGSVAAAWAAEALFRDLDDQVVAFQRNQFQRGDATSLRQQIDRFKEQLRAIDTAARDIITLRGGEYSIGALTRQGEAHEYLATQESRLGELIQLSREEQQQFQRAEAAIANLERLATRVERQNPDLAQQTRDRAQALRDQLQQQQDERRQRVQAAFDQESAAERQLAIINYATAIHTARTQNIPTPFAARALERLRLEENQPLMDQALQNQRAFEYRPGMFNAEAPGATLTQATPVATPGLASE